MSGGSSWQPHCARTGSAVLSSHRMICICFHNGPCKAVCFRTATTMYMYLKASRNIKVVEYSLPTGLCSKGVQAVSGEAVNKRGKYGIVYVPLSSVLTARAPRAKTRGPACPEPRNRTALYFGLDQRRHLLQHCWRILCLRLGLIIVRLENRGRAHAVELIMTSSSAALEEPHPMAISGDYISEQILRGQSTL